MHEHSADRAAKGSRHVSHIYQIQVLTTPEILDSHAHLGKIKWISNKKKKSERAKQSKPYRKKCETIRAIPHPWKTVKRVRL